VVLSVAGASAAAHAVTVLQPRRGLANLNLRELWAYRELLYFLVWRDIKVRYRQAAFGVAWAVGQPLLMMLVFSVFLGRLARVPSDGVPYPVFVFAGLVPWSLFAQVLQNASESLVRSSDMITKIYFPRVLLPIAAGGAYLFDFAVASAVLLAVAFFFHVQLSVGFVLLPALGALTLLTALSVAIWLSALNVRYRDVRHTVPFLIQLWLFATPVIYPVSMLPEPWRAVYAVNPMVGVIETFRWCVLGSGRPPGLLLLISAGATLLILGAGMIFFRAVERTFADVI